MTKMTISAEQIKHAIAEHDAKIEAKRNKAKDDILVNINAQIESIVNKLSEEGASKYLNEDGSKVLVASYKVTDEENKLLGCMEAIIKPISAEISSYGFISEVCGDNEIKVYVKLKWYSIRKEIVKKPPS